MDQTISPIHSDRQSNIVKATHSTDGNISLNAVQQHRHRHGHSMSRSFSSSSSSPSGPFRPPNMLQPSSNHPSTPGAASPSLSTPTSPVKSSFSSPALLRLPSSPVFASYRDASAQPPPSSTASDIDHPPPPLQPPALTVDMAALPPAMNPASGYTRPYTKSFSVGTPYHPSQSQPQVRRIKTSMSALSSLDPASRLAQRNFDPKSDTSLITIRARFVSKDLWIRVDIPRNNTVQQARDLILKRCQLTLAPTSTPSSFSDTSLQNDEPTPTGLGSYQAQMDLHIAEAATQRDVFSNANGTSGGSDKLSTKAGEADSDPHKTPTNKIVVIKAATMTPGFTSDADIQTSHSGNSLSKSTV
ncbi:hypothetical protein BG004_002177, partial [Podila humilis]